MPPQNLSASSGETWNTSLCKRDVGGGEDAAYGLTRSVALFFIPQYADELLLIAPFFFCEPERTVVTMCRDRPGPEVLQIKRMEQPYLGSSKTEREILVRGSRLV